MKVQGYLPTELELNAVIHSFNRAALHLETVTELELLRTMLWARFEPRLAELIVKYLSQNWQSLCATTLKSQLISWSWPGVFGVLAEMAMLGIKEPGEKVRFRDWMHWIVGTNQIRLAKQSYQSFFIGLTALGGGLQQKSALSSLRIYQRWGFYGSDLLWNKSEHGKNLSRTHLSKAQRMERLRDFLKHRTRLTVAEYRAYLGYDRVSLRTAELDLAQSPRLRKMGLTQGRVYLVRTKTKKAKRKIRERKNKI